MAYMSQDEKKVIHSLLKDVIPKEFKFSLSVRDHSVICLKLKSDKLFGEILDHMEKSHAKRVEIGEHSYFSGRDYYIKWGIDVNPHHYDRLEIKSIDLLRAIMGCLNHNNFNNSDMMTDYFNVGHYVDFHIYPISTNSVAA